MFRFKTCFGGGRMAREFLQYKTEARITVTILNRFTQTAQPAYA